MINSNANLTNSTRIVNGIRLSPDPFSSAFVRNSVEKGICRDGPYDFDKSKPPSGYKYIGKADDLVPGAPAKAGRKKVFFTKLDKIFSPG